MSIDKATLNNIRSHLEAAAQTIDYANTDCEHELENCAEEITSAMGWLDEAYKRHDKTTTRVLVRAEFLVDVRHPRSMTTAEVNDHASEYVAGGINPSFFSAPSDIYGEYLDSDIDVEPDVEVDE